MDITKNINLRIQILLTQQTVNKMKTEKVIIILLLLIGAFQIFQYVTRDDYREEVLTKQNEVLHKKMDALQDSLASLDLQIELTDTTISITRNYYNEKESKIYVINDDNELRDSIRTVWRRLGSPRFD